MNQVGLIKTALIPLISLQLLSCSESEEELIARAQGIHGRVITLDTHADINTGNFTASRNYTQDLDTQVNLPKMEAGGLDVAWFIVYTGQGSLDEKVMLQHTPMRSINSIPYID